VNTKIKDMNLETEGTPKKQKKTKSTELSDSKEKEKVAETNEDEIEIWFRAEDQNDDEALRTSIGFSQRVGNLLSECFEKMSNHLGVGIQEGDIEIYHERNEGEGTVLSTRLVIKDLNFLAEDILILRVKQSAKEKLHTIDSSGAVIKHDSSHRSEDRSKRKKLKITTWIRDKGKCVLSEITIISSDVLASRSQIPEELRSLIPDQKRLPKETKGKMEYGIASHVVDESILDRGSAPELSKLVNNDPNSVQTAILLAKKYDQLFDEGYISVDPSDRKTVLFLCCLLKELTPAKKKTKMFSFADPNAILKLRTPDDMTQWPPAEFFDWHLKKNTPKHTDSTLCNQKCKKLLSQSMHWKTLFKIKPAKKEPAAK